MFAAAGIAAALAVGGVLGYRYIQERDAAAAVERRDAVGPMVSQSRDDRPAWITSEVRFSSYCTNTDEGLSCVGVSSYTDNEEDAREEARQAALEAVVNAVGLQITDAAWNRNVATIFGDARQTKLATYDHVRKDPSDDKYDSARRTVREGRRVVTESFRKTSSGLAPTQPTDEYWEQYQAPAGPGSRYLVFVQYRLPTEQVARLVENYSRSSKALGASAVTYFPGIAWRYADVDTGAVIATLDSGDLKAIGLAERYIVTSVQDRQIRDAAAFADIVSTEVERLRKEGGNLKMMVKTGDTPQVEYNRPVQATIRDRPTGTRPPSTSRPPTTTPISPWDRYRQQGGSRDDPTQ
jgi:hypothetical protein